jgi:hypothetical protein
MDPEQDYTWILRVGEALQAGDLVNPPDPVRERASRLFHTRQLAPGLLQRVRAALIFDSRRRDLARAGVRASGVMEGSWQLLYRGGDVDIDLLVRPNQDGQTLSVRGQALSLAGAGITGGEVEALPLAQGRQSRAQLEPTGEFALSNLERGRYDMFVRVGAREIELNDVEL